jgi:hypothetical protein
MRREFRIEKHRSRYKIRHFIRMYTQLSGEERCVGMVVKVEGLVYFYEQDDRLLLRQPARLHFITRVVLYDCSDFKNVVLTIVNFITLVMYHSAQFAAHGMLARSRVSIDHKPR